MKIIFGCYSFSLGFRDLFYSIILFAILCASSQKNTSEKKEIETRLKEVCFRYNDSCDSEIGGCQCIAKASKYDVDYILNK